MVDRLNRVQQRITTWLGKADLDDVTLCRREHDTGNTFLALEAALIGGHDFHRRAAKREVVCSRARDVRHEESHDLALLHAQRVAWLVIDEEHVSDASHEGEVGTL